MLKEVIELVYFMRGAIQYDEMLRRTFVERQMVDEFVRDRLTAEQKKPFPTY